MTALTFGLSRVTPSAACSASSRGVIRPARTSAARAVASWRAHSSHDITVMAAPPGWWKGYYQGGTQWEGRTVTVNPPHPTSPQRARATGRWRSAAALRHAAVALAESQTANEVVVWRHDAARRTR